MRVCFTGSRKWRKFGIIRNVLNQLVAKYGKDNLVIIHGYAKEGADIAVNNLAYGLGLELDPYPAKWTELGKAAGVIRNQQMIDEGKPDLVIAFHMGTSGTQDMIDRTLAAGIPLAIYSTDGKVSKHNWKGI